MKIIFIGQPLYFRSHYADLLQPNAAGIEGVEVPFSENLTPFETLLNLEADMIVAFRGELIPSEVVETWKGIKVHIATEPMPRLREDGQVEISNDRGDRMWQLKNGTAKYDRTYIYDRTSRTYMEKYGIRVDGEFILPISEIETAPTTSAGMAWDVIFWGRETSHRAQVTGILKHYMGERYLQIAHGITGYELAHLASRATIGLNVHVDALPSMEPRLQQMMALNLAVFSEPLSHNDLFKPGVHYVEFTNSQDLWGKLVYYINHPAELYRIRQAGYDLVRSKLAVTEWKRLADMLMAGKTYLPPTSERKRH